MADSLSVDGEQQLAELSNRFSHWRAVKTYRGDPIPEALWAEVIELSQVVPRRRLCRTLRLSDTDLKKRLGMAVPRRSPPPARATDQPEFVELTEVLGPNVAPLPVAELAVERADGVCLRLRHAGAVAELIPFVQQFLASR